jgi:hypothetical protein
MEFLKRSLLWFATGFGLSAGVTSVILLATYFEKPVSVAPIEHPKDLQVSGISRVSFTHHFVLTGVLTNHGTQSYDGASLEVAFMSSGKLLYRCGDYNDLVISPGSSVAFQVRCEEVESVNVPPDVTFQVSVVRASTGKAAGA